MIFFTVLCNKLSGLKGVLQVKSIFLAQPLNCTSEKLRKSSVNSNFGTSLGQYIIYQHDSPLYDIRLNIRVSCLHVLGGFL